MKKFATIYFWAGVVFLVSLSLVILGGVLCASILEILAGKNGPWLPYGCGLVVSTLFIVWLWAMDRKDEP